jgi:hypothetical protein
MGGLLSDQTPAQIFLPEVVNFKFFFKVEYFRWKSLRMEVIKALISNFGGKFCGLVE